MVIMNGYREGGDRVRHSLPGKSQVTKVSLEILIRIPFEKQLDQRDPICSQEGLERPSVEYLGCSAMG